MLEVTEGTVTHLSRLHNLVKDRNTFPSREATHKARQEANPKNIPPHTNNDTTLPEICA